jgi:hypothetical protein
MSPWRGDTSLGKGYENDWVGDDPREAPADVELDAAKDPPNKNGYGDPARSPALGALLARKEPLLFSGVEVPAVDIMGGGDTRLGGTY